MEHKRLMRVFISSGLALVVVLSMMSALILQADAQDGGDATATPDDEPLVPIDEIAEAYNKFYGGDPIITGDAEWTIANNTFQSNYPVGFDFSIEVSSSGGDIVSARVIWSHNIGNRRSRPVEWDEETGIATLNHETSIGEAVPAWVAMNYKWSFEDSTGNLYETQWFLGEEYDDNVDDWTRSESDDVIVFAERGLPSDVGQQVIDAMAAQRETYRQAWGGLLPYKPRAILYSNRDSWNEWQIGTTNSRVIGTTREEWGATVQVVSGGNVFDLAYGTVLHEIAHLYQGAFAGAFATASWFNEGNATFFELSQQYDYEGRIRALAANNELPIMLEGTGPGQSSTGPDGRSRLGYDAGYTFWKWIVENYGLDAHREIIERWRKGGLRNEVLEDVLGISAAEIERQWREWLGATGEAPTLIPLPTFRLPPTQAPYQSPTPKSE